MKYYKVYTDEGVLVCWVKAVDDTTVETLPATLSCPTYKAVEVTEQCFEEFVASRDSNWDLKKEK